MSKFKVGDKVRCIEAYSEEKGRLVLGGIYTITSIGKNIIGGDGTELITLEGTDVKGFACRFELATPAFKPGDRVAVAFEDVIESICFDNAYFNAGIETLAVPLSSLTKLTDPIPTANGAIIRLETASYGAMELTGTHWFETGFSTPYNMTQVRDLADIYGFTVLYAGDES